MVVDGDALLNTYCFLSTSTELYLAFISFKVTSLARNSIPYCMLFCQLSLSWLLTLERFVYNRCLTINQRLFLQTSSEVISTHRYTLFPFYTFHTPFTSTNQLQALHSTLLAVPTATKYHPSSSSRDGRKSLQPASLIDLEQLFTISFREH